MSITRARTSSVAQGPSTRKTVLGGNDVILPGSYDAIGTAVVGSGGTSDITFSSIPSTYKHLQIRGIVRSNRATYPIDDLRMQFNGGGGGSYNSHTIYGTGTSAAAENYTNTAYAVNAFACGTTTANNWGAVVIDILDYANTNKNKTVRWLAGEDTNGTSYGGYLGTVGLNSSVWLATTAISSIKLYPGFGTVLAEYSTLALYGIK